jgi:LPXTG-site transpeptidase (sortase) family protein
MKRLFSVSSIIAGIGLVVLASFLLWRRSDTRWLTLAAEPRKIALAQTDIPTAIRIPRVHIDLPIYPATIHNGDWEQTTQGVSYLSDSPRPGAWGNSILYGHNWPTLLAPLHDVIPGDELIIVDAAGKERTFIVQFINVVTPDQTHVLQPTPDHRITLYTCTGFLDLKRLVVTAILADSTTASSGTQTTF